MAYGLSPRLFIEDGPAISAARSAAARRSSKVYRAWRNLDADRRLALVEKALVTSDISDGCGLALCA